MKKLVLICVGMLTLLATTCEKEDMNKCDRKGIVKDYTGLDGCGLIIESDGDRFEPAELPEGKTIKNGDIITFSYEKFDGASICMTGELVKITCLEVITNECRPVKVVKGDELQKAKKPPFKLNNYSVEKGILKMNISFSGCGDNLDQVLMVSSAEMKSLPPQRACVLEYEPQMCEAYITTDLCFDVSFIKYETILNIETTEGTKKLIIKP